MTQDGLPSHGGDKPEFSRLAKARPLPSEPLALEATLEERAALARRFGLPSIESLMAEITLAEDGKAVSAHGLLKAAITQMCAVSGEDFPVVINEPLAFRFVEECQLAQVESNDEEIEIELSADDLDEVPYSGDSFDLGEAISQSLGLAIDPYAEGPNADAARAAAGIKGDDAPTGPLADALAALKRD